MGELSAARIVTLHMICTNVAARKRALLSFATPKLLLFEEEPVYCLGITLLLLRCSYVRINTASPKLRLFT